MPEDPISEYNYSTFTTSEARGKTKVFANAVRAGDEAPDFELPTLDGGRVKLSQFRGEKYVVLQFGAIT
jgi:peroxiredoxin